MGFILSQVYWALCMVLLFLSLSLQASESNIDQKKEERKERNRVIVELREILISLWSVEVRQGEPVSVNGQSFSIEAYRTFLEEKSSEFTQKREEFVKDYGVDEYVDLLLASPRIFLQSLGQLGGADLFARKVNAELLTDYYREGSALSTISMEERALVKLSLIKMILMEHNPELAQFLLYWSDLEKKKQLAEEISKQLGKNRQHIVQGMSKLLWEIFFIEKELRHLDKNYRSSERFKDLVRGYTSLLKIISHDHKLTLPPLFFTLSEKEREILLYRQGKTKAFTKSGRFCLGLGA